MSDKLNPSSEAEADKEAHPKDLDDVQLDEITALELRHLHNPNFPRLNSRLVLALIREVRRRRAAPARGPCILADCERMAELCYAHSAQADNRQEARPGDFDRDVLCGECSAKWDDWMLSDPALGKRSTEATPTVDGIRALGWVVAVHNDYRQGGIPRTFWLFTKGDRAIKGEGRSDAEALCQVREQIRDDGTLRSDQATPHVRVEDSGLLRGEIRSVVESDPQRTTEVKAHPNDATPGPTDPCCLHDSVRRDCPVHGYGIGALRSQLSGMQRLQEAWVANPLHPTHAIRRRAAPTEPQRTQEAKTPSGMGHAMRVLLQAVANGTMPAETAWISVMREIDPPEQRTTAKVDGPDIESRPNADAGDWTGHCSLCLEERDEPHTWRECAERSAKEVLRLTDLTHNPEWAKTVIETCSTEARPEKHHEKCEYGACRSECPVLAWSRRTMTKAPDKPCDHCQDYTIVYTTEGHRRVKWCGVCGAFDDGDGWEKPQRVVFGPQRTTEATERVAKRCSLHHLYGNPSCEECRRLNADEQRTDQATREHAARIIAAWLSELDEGITEPTKPNDDHIRDVVARIFDTPATKGDRK